MKTAVLFTFEATTRMVIDIPCGMTLKQYMRNPDNFNLMTEYAKEKMLHDIDDYMCPDNMYWEEDRECPAQDFE